MTDKVTVDNTDALWIKRLAEARGLGLAHALFGEAVAAAVARGSAVLGPLPANFSSTTEPAVTFDPASFADTGSANANSRDTSSAGISFKPTSFAEPT
jgi:hypothetical protein